MTTLIKQIVLKPHQLEPATLVLSCINANKSCQLTACVGSGKSFMILDAIDKKQKQDMVEHGYRKTKFLVMPTSKGALFWRKLAMEYGIEIDIMSHDSIKAGIGDLWLDWQSSVVNGEIEYEPFWLEDNKPDYIVIDENQKVKNPNALITKIITSAIAQGIKVILVSATPFSLFDETFIPSYSAGFCNSIRSWKQMLASYLSWRDPHKPHPTIMARYCQDLIDAGYLIKVKNVRFPFKGNIKFEAMEFDNPKKALIYAKAWEKYLLACAKAGKEPPRSALNTMRVAMLQFRKAAEFLKVDLLVKLAVGHIKDGKQVTIAFNFIPSLLFATKVLKVLGVPMTKIGTIIGGQNEILRQKEINMYQAGKLDVMLLMLKAGGDTLTLSHNIVNGLARPRIGLMPVCWSIIDLVQLMGRLHRIDSISDTWQYILCYKGTIEEQVYSKVAGKSCSLSALIGSKLSLANVLAPEFVKNSSLFEKEELSDVVVDETDAEEYAVDAFDIVNN